MTRLEIGGPGADRDLVMGRAELRALSDVHQVPDVGELVPGRSGRAVRLAGLAEEAGATGTARFVHVESADGSFTANVAMDEALHDGLVLYELDGEELPARFGGPFRLLFTPAPDGEEDCSVNVKQLGRLEFVKIRGSHTARCVDD